MQHSENDRIQAILSQLEQQHNAAILYACESGSRAWGFASPDSDYDARFIYIHPASHYLSIADKRSVIEHPVDSVLDIGGWDIRKALQLLLRSNAPLMEWLQSPIVYRQQPGFVERMREIAPLYFSPRAAIHHYSSMAANALRDLQGEQVRLKRYFYALRPLLAAMWTARRGEIPPMEFHLLRELIEDADINHSIDELLALKIQSDERANIAPVLLLNTFISRELLACDEAVRDIPAHKYAPDALDELFRSLLSQQ